MAVTSDVQLKFDNEALWRERQHLMAVVNEASQRVKRLEDAMAELARFDTVAAQGNTPRQAEIERFLRAATLFESKAIELSGLGSEACKPLVAQAIEDANAMSLWARRMANGWTVVRPEGETE